MQGPDASRGRWERCPGCTQVPHDPALCAGRMAGCCCRFCGHWREIIVDAGARPSDPLIRELLVIIRSKTRREQLAGTGPD